MEPSSHIMQSKRLIIVVDSASELEFHWKFALNDLIDDIIRFLHPEGSTSQDPNAPIPLLGLVVYGSQGPCSEPFVDPCGWTYDRDTFLQRLSTIPFTSGVFSEAALARALSSTLQIVATTDDSEAEVCRETHCVLVSSYKSTGNESASSKLETFLVARKFIESSVTLSVISSRQSSRLREIFWAGNPYKPMDDGCTGHQKNHDYLILLSDNFKESHAALSYRDYIVEPSSEKGLYFGKLPVRTGKKRSSGINRVFDAGPSSDASHVSCAPIPMISDFLTEALPRNSCEPSLTDILTEIEVRLLEYNDNGYFP